MGESHSVLATMLTCGYKHFGSGDIMVLVCYWSPSTKVTKH